MAEKLLSETDRLILELAGWYRGWSGVFEKSQAELLARAKQPDAAPAYLQGKVEGQAEVLSSFATALVTAAALVKLDPDGTVPDRAAEPGPTIG